MKRTLSILLILALTFSILPAAVHAGGGYEVVWAQNFDGPDALHGWTILDADEGDYGFVQYTTPGGETCVASPFAHDGSGGKGTESDEYLISPPISLSKSTHEYELTYISQGQMAEDAYRSYTYYRILIVDADAELTAKTFAQYQHREYDLDLAHASQEWTQIRYDLTTYAGKQIRLVFHHYDRCANALRLDDLKITEYDPDEHIERIAVTNVPEPAIGLRASDLKESDIRVSSPNLLSLVPGSLEYLQTENESGIPFTGEFASGREYSVRFQLKPGEYSFTYADAIASVNGKRGIYYLDDNGTPKDASDDVITIDYYFGYLYEPISAPSVTVTPPKIGSPLQFAVSPGQDTFRIESVRWFELNDNGLEGKELDSNDTVASGKRYRCWLTLMRGNGYYFPEDVCLLVNGVSCPCYRTYADGAASFCADFTASDRYTVTFLNAHGDDPEPQEVVPGGCAAEPGALTAKDFLFLGWCVDPECREPFDFSTPITGDLLLYSKWLYTPEELKAFADVNDSGQYFFTPVYWAVAKGVTTGTSDTLFSPSAPCTRAQVVTFLWRAAGKPAPASKENPFKDVKEGQYYYDAVLWAVEKGITTGTGPDTFRPDQICTRGQIVTFLWRYSGAPDPMFPKTTFTDVPETEFYARAVAWAVEHDVTKGKSATVFAPGDVCTRAQIVTFLFRATAF